MKVNNRIIVVEIKDDKQIYDTDSENIGKYRDAIFHFEIINEELSRRKDSLRYKFTMLTPKSFLAFFEILKKMDSSSIDNFYSELDVKIKEMF